MVIAFPRRLLIGLEVGLPLAVGEAEDATGVRDNAAETHLTACSLETCSHTPSVARIRKRSFEVSSNEVTSGSDVMYGTPSCSNTPGEGTRTRNSPRVERDTDTNRCSS